MTFMTRDDVNLVAFDRAFQLGLRFLCDNAVAEDCGHFLNRIFVHLQFGGDLPIGEIQSHKVKAKHPNAQGLMMSGKHGSGEVVEGTVAHSTEVSLPLRLCFIVSVFGDLGGVAMRTFDAFGPTKLPNHLVAFGVVDQSVNIDSHPA